MHPATAAAAKIAGTAKRKVTISWPSAQLYCFRPGRELPRRSLLLAEPLPGITINNRNNALLSNYFDCAAAVSFPTRALH